jgi:phosphate ABC transporter, phosphate-binding protein
MNSKYTIIGALAIVIIVASVAGYIYLSSPASSETNPTPTPTAQPTAAPTTSPTAGPSTSTSPTAAPTHGPTTAPTTSPSTTPTTAPTASPTPQPAIINGAGATFPYPLLNAMINAYTGTRSWATVNYQSVGSGAGITAIQTKTVQFACSDAPLSASDTVNVPNAVQIPETIGSVSLAYNLPGIATGLKLNGTVIANIYLGSITNWNDTAIRQLNPGVSLPNQTIVVAHRSDSSGTTFVFTGYLSAVSPTWNTTVGQGKAVAWPVAGLASSGNPGVAAIIEGQAYTFGYVELNYAIANSMKVAAVQNPSGNYVMPTLASTTSAGNSVASMGLPSGSQSWSNVNILNAPAADAYPIVSFSYTIVYKELNVLPGMTQAQAVGLVQWLWYMVHDGQSQAAGQYYATLPANVVSIDEATIKSITFNGVQVYQP